MKALKNYQMIKLYKETVEVIIGKDGLPAIFIWRKKLFYVTKCTVVSTVIPNILPLYFWPQRYHCETAQGVVYELVKQDTWILEKTWEGNVGNLLFYNLYEHS